MIENFPVKRVIVERAVRLVTTARLRPSVLAALVSAEEINLLAEIEGVTSERLVRQERGATNMAPMEFVAGIPMATFINAAFAYPRPGAFNRFNGPDRGAWYAAMEVETAIAEVTFHLTRELDNIGVYDTAVDYAELHASFIGDFLDLRDFPEPRPECLDSNTDLAYPHGNAIASAVRAKGLSGIIYPSARRSGGTCLVALTPHAVQEVRQGQVIRLRWNGQREPEIIMNYQG